MIGQGNGDTNLDAVFANSFQRNRVCLGDGSGGFTCSDVNTDTNRSGGVALGDVDGDTNLDAVFANFNQRNRVCLGDGVGGFTCSDVSTDTNSSFDVAVVSAVEDPFVELVDTIAGFGLTKGLEISLTKSVSNAAKSFDNGDVEGACDKLDSLIDKINAQDGKKLTTEQATELRDGVQGIIVADCSVEPETIFAVAYTDIDTSDGGYNPAVDVLIAKWVDDNGSGVADAGDKIITDQYPRDFGVSSFGTFGVTEHTVASVGASNGATECVAILPNGSFGEDQLVSFSADAIFERYSEWGDFPQGASETSFIDHLSGLIGGDNFTVTPASPSQAPEQLNAQTSVGGDDAFLDVELNC